MSTGTKPSIVAIWDSSQTNWAQPNSTFQTSGYATGATVPSQHFNYQWNAAGLWQEWLSTAEFGFLDATSQTWAGKQLFGTTDDGSGSDIQTGTAISSYSVFLHTDGPTAGTIAWNAYLSGSNYYSFNQNAAYRVFWDVTTGDLIFQNASGEPSGTALTWYDSLKITSLGIDSPQISENGTTLISKYLAITTAASTYLTQTAAAANYAPLASPAFAGTPSAPSLTLPSLSVTQGSGIASDVLSAYEHGNFASGGSNSIQVSYVRAGNRVTLHFSNALVTVSGSVANINFGSIPAPLRPAVFGAYVASPVAVVNNNGSATLGLLAVDQFGEVYLFPSLDFASVSATFSGNSGFAYDTEFTYLLN